MGGYGRRQLQGNCGMLFMFAVACIPICRAGPLNGKRKIKILCALCLPGRSFSEAWRLCGEY